jgi:transposase
MAQERLTVRKIREIIRLKYEAGLSDRAIAGACKVSNSTVGEYLRRAKAAGLSWPLPDLGEDELYRCMFPERKRVSSQQPRPMPDWEEVRQELRQKGVTLRLLWMEYKEKHPKGYQYSRYCEHYQRWKKSRAQPDWRRDHVGGEQMQVDYAGVKIPITNPESGEVWEASVFVAVLPASNYTYAEAQASENQCNWIQGHVRTFDFIGGVVRIVTPDNLKNAVRKPNYYEPDINPAYQALAEHYQFAVLPTRVRKPKDKGKVENGVQNVERWVLAPLRKHIFFSLQEANQALREQLEWFNNRTMQAVGRSRRAEFEEIDRPNLRALPERPYEYFERKAARVHIDYHVEFDRHLYSVPHPLIHQEVEIRATEHVVEVFHQGKSVAVHLRNSRQGRFTTRHEHMPPNHQFLAQINAEQLVQWAAAVGPQTALLVASTLNSRKFPEQAYRSCLGILNLAKKHPQKAIEQACLVALENRMYSYRAVKDELDWLCQQTIPQAPETLPPHENIRGNQYFQ